MTNITLSGTPEAGGLRRGALLCIRFLIVLSALTLALPVGAADPMGCPDFTVELPRDRKDAPVVKAADYGFSTGTSNNAAAVCRALAAAKQLGAKRVELAAGTYFCHDAQGILLDGLEDFTLDGRGARLLFARPSKIAEEQSSLDPLGANVIVRDCRRVWIGNFSMDWDWASDPIGVWVRLLEKHLDEADNASYVDFELMDLARHPKYPARVPVLQIYASDRTPSGACVAIPGKSVWHGAAQGHFGAKSEWLAPNRLRVWPCVAQPGEYQCAADLKRYSPAANRQAVGRFDVGATYVLTHYYYGKNAFNLISCRDLTLKDIVVDSCRGFGVEVSGTQCLTDFVNVRFAPFEGTRHPFSCSADGFHVVQSRGHFRFIGCEWAACQDDFVNLHDRTTIAWPDGTDALEVVNTRGVAYFGAVVGDEVELRESDYAATGWRGRITAITGERLTFDRPVPQPRGTCFVVINRSFSTNDYLFRDCVFRDSGTSRCIVTGENVTIENCRFERMMREPLRMSVSYTPNVWCEGALLRNVVVRGCTFRDCFAQASGARQSQQIFIGGRIPWQGDPVMKQVPIANERFRAVWEKELAKGLRPHFDRAAISGFLVESNRFVNVPGYVLVSPNGHDVVFRENQIVREGEPLHRPFDYAGRIQLPVK